VSRAVSPPAPAPPSLDVGRRGSATGWLAAGVGGVGTVLLAGRLVGYRPSPCALLAQTGVPCPVCGLTRVAVRLLGGEVTVAVQLDPIGVVLLILVTVVAGAQLMALAGRPAPWLRRRWVPLVLTILLAARWAVTVAAGGPPG